MHGKWAAVGDVKAASINIPPPTTQRQSGSVTQKKWTRLAILFLVVLSWTKLCSLLQTAHVEDDSKYIDLMREYMEHGNALSLRGAPNEQSALATSRQCTSKPHMAGSPRDLETAKEFLADLQRELGIDRGPEVLIYPAGTDEATLNISTYGEPTAWITTYYPILNSPLYRSLEVFWEDGTPAWNLELEEFSDETDPEAAEYTTAVPAWHGISRGGEARGELIYVNYGRKEDYDELVAAGIDSTGKIVLARYGKIFRGLKVKAAQELGAAAVLIYSDPRDDGTATTKNGYLAYPYGPVRNPTSVQRGSVQFLSLYPGDPSTPGYPAYENSTYLLASCCVISIGNMPRLI